MHRTDSFDAFWLHYLRVHSQPRTRQIHYLAITVGIAGILASLFVRDFGLIAVAAVAAAYLIAWSAHLTVERNNPAFFEAPLWSLAAGLRMYVLGITGRLGPHLERAGVGRPQDRRPVPRRIAEDGPPPRP